MIHAKRIHPNFFDVVVSGEKTFEVRAEDENTVYSVGDYLALNECDGEDYTGRSCMVRITYVLREPAFVKEGCCILGFHAAGVSSADCDPFVIKSPYLIPVITRDIV